MSIWQTVTVVAGAAAILALGACGTFGGGDAPRLAMGHTVSGDPVAARVGAGIISQGGSAVDAVIAMGLTLAVTRPSAASLGGGGLCLVYDKGRVTSVDFLPRVPYQPGPVAVPGVLRGFDILHQRWGRLSWDRLAEPAARFAASGHGVSRKLAQDLRSAEPMLSRSPALRAQFASASGGVLREGEILRQRELATILERVGLEGPKVFYKRLIARDLLSGMQGAGGTVTGADLAEYRTQTAPAQSISGSNVILYLPGGHTGSGALLKDLWAKVPSLDPGSMGTAQGLASGVGSLYGEIAGQYGITPFTGADYGSVGFYAAGHDGTAAVCGLTMGGPFGTGRRGLNDGVIYAEAPAEGRTGLAGAFLSPVIAVDEDSRALLFMGIGAGNGAAPAAVTSLALGALRGGVPLLDLARASGGGVQGISCNRAGQCTIAALP